MTHDETRVHLTYAAADAGAAEALRARLRPCRALGLLETEGIEPQPLGRGWTEQRARRVVQADVVLLLVSPNLLRYESPLDREIQLLMGLVRRGQVRLLPVVIQDCDWSASPFAGRRSLPARGAIQDAARPDEAWDDVIAGLLEEVFELRHGRHSVGTTTARMLSLDIEQALGGYQPGDQPLRLGKLVLNVEVELHQMDDRQWRRLTRVLRLRTGDVALRLRRMRRGASGVIIDVLGAPSSLLQLEESQERGELSELCRLPVTSVQYLPPEPVRLPVPPRREEPEPTSEGLVDVMPVRRISAAGARVQLPTLPEPMPGLGPRAAVSQPTPTLASARSGAGDPLPAEPLPPSFGFQPSSPGVSIGRFGGSTAEDLAVVSQSLPAPVREPPETVQTGVHPTHGRDRARLLRWAVGLSVLGVAAMALLLLFARSPAPVPAPGLEAAPAPVAEAEPVVEAAPAPAPAPVVGAAPADPTALSTREYEALALDDALARQDPVVYRAALGGHLRRTGEQRGGRLALHTEALLSLSQAERAFPGAFERLVVPAPPRLEFSGDAARTRSFTLGRGVAYGETRLRVLVLERQPPAALVRVEATSGEARPATGWVLASQLGI